MTCTYCEQPIPQARLDALPDTITCIGCSEIVRYQGAAEGLTKSHVRVHILDPNTATGREDIARITRYTPYRFGNSVMYTGTPQTPFGKG